MLNSGTSLGGQGPSVPRPEFIQTGVATATNEGREIENFADLYGHKAGVESAKWNALIAYHDAHIADDRASFGLPLEPVVYYSAPAMIQLLGTQTSHQNGKVLTATVSHDYKAAVTKTSKGVIRIRSGMGVNEISINKLQPQESDNPDTSMVRAFLRTLKDSGYCVGGMDITISSDKDEPSQLGYPASVLMLIGKVQADLYNNGRITVAEIAKAGQSAASIRGDAGTHIHEYFGCAAGGLNCIDFKNPEQPQIHPCSRNSALKAHQILVIEPVDQTQGTRHELAEIQTDMTAVANAFGKKALRDVTPEEFGSELHSLGNQGLSARAIMRAMHFFAETRRVQNAFAALNSGANPAKVLELISESGGSSDTLLQNAAPTEQADRQETLLTLHKVRQVLGQLGCRPTEAAVRLNGEGFGNGVVVFVPDYQVEEFKLQLSALLDANTMTIIALSVRTRGIVNVSKMMQDKERQAA